MDKVPFEEQRVIDELVEFWQTRYEPCDLVTHIDGVSGTWGGVIDTKFFRQVYEDLCADKHSYVVSSASEFKQLLEDKYHRAQKKDKASFFKQRFEDLRKHSNYVAYSPLELKQLVEAEYRQARAKAEAERQAQAKAKAERQAKEAERQAKEKAEDEHHAKARTKKREEYERKRANLGLFGDPQVPLQLSLFAEGPPSELVCLDNDSCVSFDFPLKDAEPGPLAPHYTNHCWNCKKSISAYIDTRCPNCGYYTCGSCGSCFCH